MSSERRVIVHPDKETLCASVAARFITKVVDLIHEFGEASIVLSGGSVGIAVLSAINASPARDTVDWSRVNIWWGDERWLPSGDPERNEVQARAALLDHVSLDPARVHAFAASDQGLELDDASAAYAAEIRDHAPKNATLPHFDITFLGLGADAHVASLFPERGGVRETELAVISVRNSPKPPSER
ncbi:MAG: 6-phosphogluconolactonase, partial [Salinibacterium sp.]|nr:6-phosphogluconolactonase [Salinibacterium sp.]